MMEILSYGAVLAGWACVVVVIASAVTALTPTPAPGTPLARIYRYIEIAALVVGRAKDLGLVRETALQVAVEGRVIAIERALTAPAAPPAPPAVVGLFLLILIGFALSACHALMPVASVVGAAASVSQAVSSTAEVVDTGIGAACGVYREAKGEAGALGLADNAKVKSLAAYGDSICDLPTPSGPIGTGVWLVEIAHGIRGVATAPKG